jgi:3-hydroxyisobutyrate dehydrogenase-like beta-hydroxyacid dehydrogenase
MKRTGVVGIGNMGMGMAKNLLKHGFPVKGYDISGERRKELEGYGGIPCLSPAEVGQDTDVVFIMVMNGDQAKEVVFGTDGLASTMKSGSCIFLTATIGRRPAEEIHHGLVNAGIHMIDCCVSGGLSGAHNGTLTLMAAGEREVYDGMTDVMAAIATSLNYVGSEPGLGQVVKSCLQALIAAEFAATFELMTLGAKAGVDPEVLLDVISSSGGGCGVFRNCVPLIMDRKFVNTGSAITTMHKDIGITMELARDLGCCMPTTAAAREVFQAGISKFPNEDNWACIKIFEDIAGTRVERKR